MAYSDEVFAKMRLIGERVQRVQPARLTPEREAELRAEHVLVGVDEEWFCRGCDWWDPCPVIEVLDTLAAERAHAQQVEVPLSSALGFAVHVRDDKGATLLIDRRSQDDHLFVSATEAQEDVQEWGDDPQLTVVAVVPVSMWPGADGRAGS